MRKTRLALAAAAIGLMTALAPTAANAYPDPVITNPSGSAADGVVAPGEAFTLAGGFDGVECAWTSSFNGAAGASGLGTTFSVTFTAPTTEGTYNVVITCTYDDGTPAVAGQGLSAVIQTMTLTYPIVVTDGSAAPGAGAGDGRGGVLPNTGGPAGLIAIAGGAALVAGGGLVAYRRRTA